MRWTIKKPPVWRKMFALFPVEAKGQVIWLEMYWYRDICGMGVDRRPIDDPLEI